MIKAATDFERLISSQVNKCFVKSAPHVWIASIELSVCNRADDNNR